MGLLAGFAAVSEGNALGGLLASLGLWPRETSVTRGGASESPLPPFELAGLLLLDPLDLMHRMLLAEWTVGVDVVRQLHCFTFGSKVALILISYIKP